MEREMKTGVVIIGHGSRVPESRGIYEEIARKTADKGGLKVRVGYMKHWRPTFTEAVRGFIEDGVKRVIIVPLFLLPGMHVQEDIPVLLGLKEGEVPEFGYEKIIIPKDVEIIYAKHIGADERLADVVMDRVREALK
jgi:sirohydrochlorin cobaltochelatase